jgi:hypothetical protein
MTKYKEVCQVARTDSKGLVVRPTKGLCSTTQTKTKHLRLLSRECMERCQ